MISKFNEFLLIKLSENIYIYDFQNNVNNNKDGTNHIFQEFFHSQTHFKLPFFRLNLRIRIFIILFCNLSLILSEYNRI